MFIDRPDAVARFDEHFVCEDGRHYFRMKRVDVMLPIAEREAVEALRAYRIRMRIAMAAMWLIWLAALTWLIAKLVAIEADGRGLLLILAGAFAATLLLHLWPPLAATWSLQRRLAALVEAQASSSFEP